MDDRCHWNRDDDKFSVESTVKFSTRPYVGRLAPTPSGYLHIGHAQTFWIAQQRSRTCSDGTGSLILRIEDLDRQRCKPHYLTDMLYDLSWFGLSWTHGPSPVTTVVDSSSSSSSSGSTADCEAEGTDDDDRLPKKSKMVDINEIEEAAVDVTNNSNNNRKRNSDLMNLVRFRSFHGVCLTSFARVFEQSRRMPLYHTAWRRLVQLRLIYPSPHSRKGHSHSHSPHTNIIP